MKKLYIIILIGLTLLSFAVAFGVTFFINRSRPNLLDEPAEGQAQAAMSETDTPGAIFIGGGDDELSMSMSEKQLQSLIYDIREKMKEYDYKEEQLDKREERLNMVSTALQEDIARLNDLRAQLTTTLASIKQQEQNLQKSLLEIDDIEKANMQRIAERYDKMDTLQASVIMINMVENKQIDDVALILNFMSERQSAKLLGEIGNDNPEIATALNAKLAHIKEIQ